jgi:hypothetical protein
MFALYSATCNGDACALSTVVTDSSLPIDECVECALLLTKYEAATFAQAKIQNALDIAQSLSDAPSLRRLTLEARDVAARRITARAAFLEHRDVAHLSRDIMATQSSDVAPRNRA